MNKADEDLMARVLATCDRASAQLAARRKARGYSDQAWDSEDDDPSMRILKAELFVFAARISPKAAGDMLRRAAAELVGDEAAGIVQPGEHSGEQGESWTR